MRLMQVHLRTLGHDAGRIYALMAAVIMLFDMAKIACLGNAGHLV